MHDSCRKQIFITDTHHPCAFMRPLSFHLKRSTNRGRRGVHVPHFCPSNFLPRIHKCPRLPAGNWVFQGQHLNSSSWLCWGRERRWFSSSLFLGQGCKRRTKRSQGGNCLSQWSKSDEAQRKPSRRRSLANDGSLQIKAWSLRFTEELWFLLHCLFMLSGGLMDLRMSNVTLVRP